MAKLSAQLRYFVNKKITEDSNWQGVEVVLSGHEVPGEGEHKIMEYIRLSRAQPDYNPNVRHCLYGLDADLIMLGLLSHDPHFCLLREEVKFGPSSRKKGRTRSVFPAFHHQCECSTSCVTQSGIAQLLSPPPMCDARIP
jgi:5'-3' exoribonuclease 1